jgi:hypothetical protein
MTQMIERKKNMLHHQMDRYTMGEATGIDPNLISDDTKNEISSITVDHNVKLKMLREQYDEFLKDAENEFFNVLRNIKMEESNEVQDSDFKQYEEDYENGELAKVARDFLAQQEKNLKVNKKANKPNNTLKPKNSNYDEPVIKRPSPISTKNDYINVNELIKMSNVKQSSYEYLNENMIPQDASMLSTSNFVDYNKEAEEGGYINLSASKSKKEETPSENISFASTKKNLQFSPSSPPEFVKAVEGDHHSAGITKSRKLFTWGRGIFGQLGHGDDENQTIPREVRYFSNIKIVSVACGWQHTLALTSAGDVFSWGYGKHGQLGHGNSSNLDIPKKVKGIEKAEMVECGHSHSATVAEGMLFMWG